MDLLCRTCGEPWDINHVGEEFTDEEKAAWKKGKCPCCPAGATPGQPLNGAAEIAGVLADLLEGDEDAQAAFLEDAERSGLLTYD